MPFEKFKTWKPLLHNLQERGISSAKLFADLILRIGDLWIVVALNRTNNVVTYSKLEDARDYLLSTAQIQPFRCEYTKKNHCSRCEAKSPALHGDTRERTTLRVTQRSQDICAHGSRHGSVGNSALQYITDAHPRLQIARPGFPTLQMTYHLTGSFHQQLIAKIGIKLLTYSFAPCRVKTQSVHAVSAAPACFVRGLIPYKRATSANSRRSSFLPRLNLDITVPTGILNVSAISL